MKIRILLCCVLLLCLTGCSNAISNGLDIQRMTAIEDPYTLEQVIQYSDCIVLGEYKETIDQDTYIEHCFEVKETLYGSVSKAMIKVFCHKIDVTVPELSFEYAADGNVYVPGESYILMLDSRDDVFFDETRYFFVGNAFLPVDQRNEQRIYNISINDVIKENVSLDKYIVSYKENNKAVNIDKSEVVFTRSDDIDDIAKITDYIIRARVDELLAEGIDVSSATFYCTPLEVIKGEELVCNERDQIGIVVPLNEVEIGNTYYFFVNHVSEMSILYKVSSLGSVYEEMPLAVE